MNIVIADKTDSQIKNSVGKDKERHIYIYIQKSLKIWEVKIERIKREINIIHNPTT